MADVVYRLDKIWTVWELRRSEQLTEADFLWITSNSLRCEVDRKIHKFDNLHSNGLPIQVAGATIIRITTETKQQEMMLKLKYGDELLMQSMEGREWVPIYDL